MEWKDYKYLLAYTIPITTFISVLFAGVWSWLTVIVAFVIIPILESILQGTDKNLSIEEKAKKEKSLFFDALLYMNVLFIYGIAVFYLYRISYLDLYWYEMIGLTLSTGILLGANGINVAHELGHKTGKLQQAAARILLLPSLYMHFVIEHNRGHHLRVGTLEDPATSRFGENIFSFWYRSISESYRSAWKIAIADAKREKRQPIDFSNPMVRFSIYQVLYLGVIFFLFGIKGLLASIGIAFVSVLLLESINYIEHYGLVRKKLPNGKYENVENFHSWNSNHEVGRILLYELTRHSDHHYKAYKKYQILDDYPDNPQLPFGYPTGILLALLPPVWFYIMNPRVLKWRSDHGYY